jgi:hypothetical protein
MTSEARFILGWAIAGGLYVLLLYACSFAFLKGRAPERLTALLYLASVLFDVVIGLAAGKTTPLVPSFVFEAMVAVGYLALAIRYNNLWLGAIMMQEGVRLALNATHMTDGTDAYIGSWNLYIVALNVLSLIMSLTIIFATLASLRARRRAAAGLLQSAPPEPLEEPRQAA